VIARTTCALRPGVDGLSENIRVRSIVGHFLEHSRIYAFEAGNRTTTYIGSPDLMTRNLDHRNEVLVPVENARVRQDIHAILDSALAFMRDGSLKVSKVADKVFMGREIIHCAVFPKDGDTNFYTMIYQDKESGKAFAKRFQIGGLSRDKLYPLVKSEGSRVVYFEVSKTEKEMPKKLIVYIDGRSGARIREFEFDLTHVPVSTRTAKGLTVSKWPGKDAKRADLALG